MWASGSGADSGSGCALVESGGCPWGCWSGLTHRLRCYHHGKFGISAWAKRSHGSAGTPGLAAGFAACELIFWDCEHRKKKPENPSAVQVAPAKPCPMRKKGQWLVCQQVWASMFSCSLSNSKIYWSLQSVHRQQVLLILNIKRKISKVRVF